MSQAEAQVVAASLIQAELRGIESHGVVRADIYLRRFEAGLINTNGTMDVKAEGTNILLDGNNHFGAVVGMKALELALDSTRRYGNAIVGVKGSNHFGICSFYLNQAVKHNVIMMIVSNAPKTMPPSVEKQLDTWGKRFQLDLREALV